MKQLTKDFNFFDYTPVEITKEEQIARNKRIAKKEIEIKERIEKFNKRMRYEKSQTIRLG